MERDTGVYQATKTYDRAKMKADVTRRWNQLNAEKITDEQADKYVAEYAAILDREMYLEVKSAPVVEEPAPPVDPLVEALRLATSAIYFADSSDYLGALWDIVRVIDPEQANLLERDELAAYRRVTPDYDDS